MNREVWLLAVGWSKDIGVNGRGWRWKEAGFGISIDFTARDACMFMWYNPRHDQQSREDQNGRTNL
jgi:hypothetical protein